MKLLRFHCGGGRWCTHGERLLPAGPDYGGSDDADVELVLLLLHHVLGQGFGVGVGVWPVTNETRRDVSDDAVLHPPNQRVTVV